MDELQFTLSEAQERAVDRIMEKYAALEETRGFSDDYIKNLDFLKESKEPEYIIKVINRYLDIQLGRKVVPEDATDFAKLRFRSGLTVKDFSEILHIAPRTMENWDKGINKCQDYILELIEYKLVHEGLIYPVRE